MSDTRRAEETRRDAAPPTPSAHDPAPEPAPPSLPYRTPRHLDTDHLVAVEVGPSGWISLIVGGLLLLLSPRFLQWLSHQALGTNFTWTFAAVDGSPLPYTRTVFFWGDLAITLFALAMLVDGLVLLLAATSRAAVWVAFGLIALATGLNAIYVIAMIAQGYGLQLMSLVAVLVGGFMGVQQWQLLTASRRRYLVVEG